jgi:hypothetical protein
VCFRLLGVNASENEGVYHLLQSIGYFHGAMCLTMTFFAAFPTVLTGRHS